jgi:hypothetical protein
MNLCDVITIAMVMVLRDFCVLCHLPIGLYWFVGEHLLLRDYGPYEIFMMRVLL